MEIAYEIQQSKSKHYYYIVEVKGTNKKIITKPIHETELWGLRNKISEAVPNIGR